MKQVQVFKKTLLSAAVVAALGGYGTFVQVADAEDGDTNNNSSQQDSNTKEQSTSPKPPVIDTKTFLKGTEAENTQVMNDLKARFSKLEGVRNAGIKGGWDDLTKVYDGVVAEVTRLKNELEALPKPAPVTQGAELSEEDRKKTKDIEDKRKLVKDAQGKADETVKAMASYLKANQKTIDIPVNDSTSTASGDSDPLKVRKDEPGKTVAQPKVETRDKDADPAQKIDWAATRVKTEGVVGSAMSVSQALVQNKDEKDDAYKERVQAAVKKINELKTEDIRKALLIKDPKAEDPDKAQLIVPKEIKLTGIDLRNTEVRTAFFKRWKEAVPEMFAESAGAAEQPHAALALDLNTFELSDARNAPQTPLPDVSFLIPSPHPSGDSSDPVGTYVLSDNSGVYQASVGKAKSVENFQVISGSSFHVKDDVNASRVLIENADAVDGSFYLTGEGEEKGKTVEGYARFVGKPYADTAVRGKSVKENEPGPVIARKKTVVKIDGLKKGKLDVLNYQDVEITGSTIQSRGIGQGIDGIAGSGGVTVKDSSLFMAPAGEENGQGITGQDIVIDHSVVESRTEVKELVTPSADLSGSNKGSQESSVPASSGSTAANEAGASQPESRQATSASVKTRAVVGLTKINGANLNKVVLDSTDGFKTSTERLVGVPDKLSISAGSKVMADIEEIEELTVAGELVSNHIGSDAARVNKVSLESGAVLKKYSAEGNTLYGSSELDLVVGKGVTVIHDVSGFHTIVLDGGVLHGSLTGLDPVEANESVEGDKGFEGSKVELKGGTYQGGVTSNIKSFLISGDVLLRPASSKLVKLDNKGNPEVMARNGMVINGDVEVSKGTVFTIEKGDDARVLPVAWNNATFQDDSGFAVVVDLSQTDRESLDTPYLKVVEKLKLNNNNRIGIKLKGDDQNVSYDQIKAMHDMAKEGKDTTHVVNVASYGEIEGAFVKPESDSVLLHVSEKVVSPAAEQAGSYGVGVSYNAHKAEALSSKYGLSDNDAAVADAALNSALDIDPNNEIGKSMYETIQYKQGYQKTADANQWDPHYGMGMAAVAVTQKTNQSISRHLNRHRTGISTGDMFESQGFWGEYFFSNGEMDTKDNVHGYENKVNGITLGLDNLLNDQLTAGFAFTYGDVKTKTEGVSREASGDTFMGTLYTGWTQDNYFFDTMWSYGQGKLDMKRDAQGSGSYTSDTNSNTMGVRLIGGYNYQMNQWLLQPQVEFNYAKVKFDDFKEKGDGLFAQSVKMSDFEVMELGAGLKFLGEYDVSNGVLKPEFTLMGYHDFKDQKAEVQGTFLNGGRTYTVVSGDREQNRFLAGIGLKYGMNNNLSLGLNYDYNWQGDYKAHGFVASVRYEF